MNKKLLIALANAIKDHNSAANRALSGYTPFNGRQLATLANFCGQANPNFKRDRWLDFIAGKCGPNGGPAKKGETV